jgi:hypothetical protein
MNNCLRCNKSCGSYFTCYECNNKQKLNKIANDINKTKCICGCLFNSKNGMYVKCYECLNKSKNNECDKCLVKITNKYKSCYNCLVKSKTNSPKVNSSENIQDLLDRSY